MARSNLRGMDLVDLVEELAGVCVGMLDLIGEMDKLATLEIVNRRPNHAKFDMLEDEFNDFAKYGSRIFDEMERWMSRLHPARNIERSIYSMRNAWIDGGKSKDAVEYVLETCESLERIFSTRGFL